MRWLLLSAGRGPGECQIAVEGLTGRLIAEARLVNVDASVVSTEPGEHGLLSALLSLTGDGAAALCSCWEGTLQWICPSPLRKGWGRKNWYVGASLLTPPEPSSILRRGEVRFEPMKASGPGGQHVNKTESAVRATHIPSGLSCVAREERSQHRNKELALARLAQAIAGRGAEAEAVARRDAWTRHDALERGNAIRVYAGPDFRRIGGA